MKTYGLIFLSALLIAALVMHGQEAAPPSVDLFPEEEEPSPTPEPNGPELPELKQLDERGYVVVDPADWVNAKGKPAQVEVGVVARVTQNGFTEDYLIAGAKDTHLPTEGKLVPVPYTSPLGNALMGQGAPGVIKTVLAGEPRVLELVSLRRPSDSASPRPRSARTSADWNSSSVRGCSIAQRGGWC